MAQPAVLPYLYGYYRICMALAVAARICGAAPMSAWIWVVHKKYHPHLSSLWLHDPDLYGARCGTARIYAVRA